MPTRSLLSPVLQRRLAVAVRHRTPLPIRSFTTTPALLKTRTPPPTRPRPALRPPTTPPPAALSALLSRLSLEPQPALHDKLIACLTHPSFIPIPPPSVTSTSSSDSSSTPEIDPDTETNELLSTLGNSLLGLFASEHLTSQYPYLPTESLKQAVTAYVGPTTCLSVAKELGLAAGVEDLGLIGGGYGSQSSGIPVRYHRTRHEVLGEALPEVERVPVARRFRKFEEGSEDRAKELEEMRIVDKRRVRNREGFEDVVACTVRAFVGLIYQELGIHSARRFVHAHFLTRHLDMAALFNFKNPKHVLSSVVARHLADAGVSPASGVGRIETRLLASTGVQSQSPIFNIALFLPSGLKLGEGHGSSQRMAEHRAAVNALHSFFLVRENSIPKLPTSVHADFPLDLEGIVLEEGEERYEGKGWGGRESNVESSKRLGRGSRGKEHIFGSGGLRAIKEGRDGL